MVYKISHKNAVENRFTNAFSPPPPTGNHLYPIGRQPTDSCFEFYSQNILVKNTDKWAGSPWQHGACGGHVSTQDKTLSGCSEDAVLQRLWLNRDHLVACHIKKLQDGFLHKWRDYNVLDFCLQKLKTDSFRSFGLFQNKVWLKGKLMKYRRSL